MTLRFGATNQGKQLGVATRTSSVTITANATPGATAGKIGSLTYTLIGAGKPVEVAIFLPNVYCSNAGVGYGLYLNINDVEVERAIGISSVNTYGPACRLSFPTTLIAGTSYTFDAGLYSLTGNAICTMNPAFPGHLRITGG